jgi:predicted nucleic acid-binding protein
MRVFLDTNVLVTGDRELQRLSQVGRLQIVSPRGFWERLRMQQPTERPQ